MPSTTNFVHHVYINVSKDILNNIRIFDVTTYDGVITNNISIVYDIIAKSIENTIREILPLKEILMSSLHSHNQESDEESQSEDEEPTNEAEEINEPEPPIEENNEEITPQTQHENEHNATSFVNEVLHDSDEEDVKTVALDGEVPLPLEDEKMEKDEIKTDTQPKVQEIEKRTPSFLD
jgi:hypothetical protein